MLPLRVGAIRVPGFMAGQIRESLVELGLWVFLVKTATTTILFDGGLVPDADITHAFVRENLGTDFGYTDGDEASVRDALKSAGFEATDIDIAVISHLHHDHAGAMHWLPKAKIWVSEDEIQTLDSPFLKNLAPDWQVTPSTHQRVSRLAHEGRLVRWSGPQIGVAAGVDLIRVGGHTRGSVALLATTEEGQRIALLGDLILTEHHLTSGAVPVTALDAYRTIKSVVRLLSLADEMWPGHAVEGPVRASEAALAWPTPNEWRDDD